MFSYSRRLPFVRNYLVRAYGRHLVRANLDGRQPVEMTLARLMEPFSAGWRKLFVAGYRRL
jgi:hypothetical protein